MRIKRAKIASVLISSALLITTLGNTVESKATYFLNGNDFLLKERLSDEYHIASNSNASLEDSYGIIEYNQSKYKVATDSNTDEKFEEIWTIQDLMDINSDSKNMEKNYILMKDLDLGGMEWIPISCIQDSWGYYFEGRFSGIFDGNSHTISNFTIINVEPRRSINSIVDYGFFGRIYGGTVENLTLKNIKFSEIGKGFTGKYGGICGYFTGGIKGGAIRNCSVYDITFENMVGTDCVGGIAGRSEGTISGCEVDSTIENVGVGGNIGGIAGEASGTISDCISNVDINAKNAIASGIATTSDSSIITIDNCINKGTIKAHKVGGILFGYKGAFTIQNCINEGTLEGGTIGGIASFEYVDYLGSQKTTANIVKCGNKGKINVTEGIGFSSEVGAGIVGKNYGLKELKISQCYNIGDITTRGASGAFSDVCGGILGIFSNGSALIEECFNAGTIELGSGDSAGGIIGESSGVDGSMEVIHCYNVGNNTYNEVGAIGSGTRNCKFVSCYYLDNINLAFYYGDQSTGVKKLSDKQMQDVSEYEGWDFNNIWIMGMDEYLYPVLQWMTEAPDMPEMSDKDKEMEIIDCSGWREDTLYTTSDIVIKFSEDIYNNPGENSTDRFEVRDYVADQVLFTWDSNFNDYSIEGNTLIIHNALKECTEWEGQVLYLHIPDGFFRNVDSEEDIVKGYTDKGKFSFVLGLSWEPTLHYVQFKYEKNGEMILHYVQSVKDGELCRAIESASWDGYEFVDWYEDEELTKPFDFKTGIYKNYILYGKYKKISVDNNVDSNTNSSNDKADNTGSENNSVHSATLRNSGFVEARDPKTGEIYWQCQRNGSIVTGYVENLYYNGEPGNFYFDEKGIMLTGWHYVNGSWRYFDETHGHRGYEITPQMVQDKLKAKSAAAEISKYNYAGTFANDLTFLDGTVFLIDNYDEIKRLIKWQILSGEDQFTNNKDWAKAYLRTVVDNLCDTTDSTQFLNKDDLVITDYVFPILKEAGYESIAELHSVMKDAMGDIDDADIDRLFMEFANNIEMLESIRTLSPVLQEVADELISEYKRSVARNLKKDVLESLIGELNVKNAVEAYNEVVIPKTLQGLEYENYISMHAASTTALNSLITSLFTDTLKNAVKGTRLNSIENMVYSAQVRDETLRALQVAERNFMNSSLSDSLELQNKYKEDYINAFNIAKEATLIQYDSMFNYYTSVGDNEKALEVLKDMQELQKKTFYNY